MLFFSSSSSPFRVLIKFVEAKTNSSKLDSSPDPPKYMFHKYINRNSQSHRSGSNLLVQLELGIAAMASSCSEREMHHEATWFSNNINTDRVK